MWRVILYLLLAFLRWAKAVRLPRSIRKACYWGGVVAYLLMAYAHYVER